MHTGFRISSLRDHLLFLFAHPALKRWAKLLRPFGTGTVSISEWVPVIARAEANVKDRLDGDVEVFPLSVLLGLFGFWLPDQACFCNPAQPAWFDKTRFLRCHLQFGDGAFEYMVSNFPSDLRRNSGQRCWARCHRIYSDRRSYRGDFARYGNRARGCDALSIVVERIGKGAVSGLAHHKRDKRDNCTGPWISVGVPSQATCHRHSVGEVCQRPR